MSGRGGTKRNHGSAAGSSSGGGGGDHSKNKQQQQVGERRRKRPRPPIDPATLPRFLDSTGSVTAGTYSARRLPEMKSLWRSFLEHKHAKSDERIAAAAAAAAASAAAEASTMAGASRTAAGASAAELLDDSWNYRSGGRKASDRHLRRRTGSHNRRRKHRFPRGLPSNNNDAGDGDDKKQAKSSNDKPPCRRARRKPAVLREAHRGWQRRSSSLSPPTARNWIETHLWHTKRFHMSPPMFGWCIPLVHTGRGTAAALRLARDGCTVQDATWSIDGGATMLSSSTLAGLIAVLGRICGAQAEFLSDKMVLAGHLWGEGTVHKLDAYPLGVIGPARFLFCRQDECYCVAIFVHPSIRREVGSALLDLVSDEEEEDKVKVDHFSGDSGIALIRVRGEKATESIKAALGPSPLSSSASSFNWVEMSKSSRVHRIVPHGTVVPVELNPTLPRNDEETDSNKGSSSGVTVDGEPENNLLSYIEGLSKSIEDTAVEALVPTNHFNGGNFAVLISHRPPNVASQLRHNTAVCGWDILCSPGIACDIFLALNHRGACSIGLAEEASAALEAEPPIPIFPRDFPDTETGEAYWSGQDAAWNVVRCCLEQGALGGRFKTELKRIIKGLREMIKDINAGEDEGQPDVDESEPKSATCEVSKKSSAPIHPFGSVEWESIATPFPDDESKDTRSVDAGVEVVRGAFGAPFVQALHDSGHFVHPEAQDEGRRKRRPRRRVRPAQMAIQANPLTEEEANAHESLCEMLLSSLSLPALIRCHISVEGRGTLEPRAAIYRYARRVDSMKDNSFKLGFIVAGAFSNNRGAFHGTAFVGAARLLQSLIDTRSSNTVSIIDPTGGEGQRKVALRVLVKNTAEGTVHRSALLTLML